jgi:hypothetical protein
MAAIVAAGSQQERDFPVPLARLRDLAVQENRDGQTAEFI